MASIEYFLEKIKGFSERVLTKDFFIVLIICSVAFSSFALGRLSAKDTQKKELRFATSTVFSNSYTSPEIAFKNISKGNVSDAPLPKTVMDDATIVASYNGTKYYFLWCEGVGRIDSKNRIYFKTKADAEKAGYELANICEE